MNDEDTVPYKVMLVVQSLRVGGAETMVENLAYAHKGLGCDVCVVALQPGESMITNRLNNANVPLIMMDKKPGMDLALIARLSRVITDFAPDVVHSNLPILHYVVPAAHKAGVTNIVHTLHNIASKETRNNVIAAFNRYAYRRGYVRPVALSETNRASVVERYGIPIESVAVVPNGIDTTRFQPKMDYRLSDPIRLVHVGRFEEAKNHAALVQAASILAARGIATRFDLYGEGSLLDRIRSSVRNQGLDKSFVFHGLTDDVPAAMSQADAFVFPSLYEGVPMVLAEAAASGLPIVASAVGGIPDMFVNGESALLCSPDAKDVADGVMRLASDQTLRETIGRGALAASQDFSSRKMAERYLTVYKAKDVGKGGK